MAEKSKNYVEVTINSIAVKFPAKPYPSQISLMDKIIKGLQRKQNCLLESPTGSGKTLALLCSALAWQFNERSINAGPEKSEEISRLANCFCDCLKVDDLKKFEKKPRIKYDDDDPYDESTKKPVEVPSKARNDCICSCHGMYDLRETEKKTKKIPKIYFASRTHKQITQVVKELRKTAYAKELKMTILSSRAHTCIHPEVSKSSKRNELCKELTNGKNSDGPNCTFLSKWKKQQPPSYEYIGFTESTWDIEDIVKIGKKKKICPYFASRDVTQLVEVIFCPYNYLIDPKIRNSMNINLDEQIVILDEAHNIEDVARSSTTFRFTQSQLEICLEELKRSLAYASSDEVTQGMQYFCQIFDRLNSWLLRKAENLDKYDFDSAMSKIWNGLEIIAEFKLLGMGPDNFTTFTTQMSKINSEEATDFVTDNTRILVEILGFILDILYKNNHEFMDDYKVAITKVKTDELAEKENQEDQSITRWATQGNNSNKWTLALNFWCLNPAVAFDYLKKCHSIILCSGTLSPLETFQSELGVKFEHQLEANHVISENQVFVASLGYGPNDKNLCATYKNVETYAFQDEIGLLVLDICKKVPFGVLCFLPSYSLLNKLMQRWSDSNLLDLVKQHKSVFSETSKGNNAFNDMLSEYYQCIDRSRADDTHNGALMLGVYRGKASEGLDFSDNYARAVIAVGIPYPNIKDVQVDLKRKYNNLYCHQKKLLNGDEWYEIQAYRAVNQALGRCIRHKNDWGAILLIDDRYFRQPQKYSKGLSKWIRKKYTAYRNYSEVLQKIDLFVNQMKEFQKSITSILLKQEPEETYGSLKEETKSKELVEESNFDYELTVEASNASVLVKTPTTATKKRQRQSNSKATANSNSILKEKYQPEISNFLSSSSSKRSRKKLDETLKVSNACLSSDSDDDFKRAKRISQSQTQSPYFNK